MNLDQNLEIENYVFFKRPKQKPQRHKISARKKKSAAPRTKASRKTTESLSPLNIFLLGDPAAGKATQAARLLTMFPLYDLDMGKELRRLQARNPRIRKALTKTYDRGHVTQTNIVRKIFRDKIFSTPRSRGLLFDGNPKQIGEAKLIYFWLKAQGRSRAVVLYLSIPMDETVRRMSGRREYFKGKFSKRTDDNKAALQNRVKYYRKNVAGVVKFLKSKFPYRQISGQGSRQQVWKRLKAALVKYKYQKSA